MSIATPPATPQVAPEVNGADHQAPPHLELPPSAPVKQPRRFPRRLIVIPLVLIALGVAAWYGYNTYR
ncbi:MAG TPA: hypothetical protein VFG86_26430, partial [Chloroflexota bacterium]|nr:hypothetical protein [Chloroflexota bacterium]